MRVKTFLIIVLSIIICQVSIASEKKKKIIVSGYVTDSNDKPLSGIAIIVDGVKSNIFTNKKGFYKIKIHPDTKTIMAYSIIYGGIEMNYKGHKKINFILKNDFTNANYISPEEGGILNYGYGKVSKKNNTASINKIDEKTMNNGNYSNIYQMIKGRVPGVTVNGSRIIIRGISSINAGTNPLFVVNGSETNSIDFINPRDVKSISVLKGSAAAMYGSRGTNGVIVITLKDGGK